ncbi:hypothetical protein EG329_007215 [Mollisiaceae sp. DMI_Dod_QoI]|nr:hypothetical protein EG329_007215 [Helotiales sp. DMI_Dod_QoI]
MNCDSEQTVHARYKPQKLSLLGPPTYIPAVARGFNSTEIRPSQSGYQSTMQSFKALRHHLLGGPSSSIVATVPPVAAQIIEDPSFEFLALPLDLRLEIYRRIANDTHSARPWESPLYLLLFVSQQVRHEVGPLFYKASGFLFPSPSKCSSFLELTEPHIHLLTSLAISLPNSDTYILEPIFRKLYEAGAPLKTLVLDLTSIASKSPKPAERDWLPHDKGARALNGARERAQDLETTYERIKRQSVGLPNENFRVADNGTRYRLRSCLANMKTIRYLAIDGNPYDVWDIEFELAVLSLHEKMFKLAMKREGADAEGLTWYGRWGDWYWYDSAESVKRGRLQETLSTLNPSLR